MNIAAAMAVLDEWQLDRRAKHAATVLACRADRHTAQATVSIARVAADMGVNYETARVALQLALAAEVVTVEVRPGFSPVWSLAVPVNPRPTPPVAPRGGLPVDPRPTSRPVPRGGVADLRGTRRGSTGNTSRPGSRRKESLGIRKSSAPATSNSKSSPARVENPSPDVAARPPSRRRRSTAESDPVSGAALVAGIKDQLRRVSAPHNGKQEDEPCSPAPTDADEKPRRRGPRRKATT